MKLPRWFRFRDAHHSEVVKAMQAITEKPTRTVPSWTVQKANTFAAWQQKADRILRRA